MTFATLDVRAFRKAMTDMERKQFPFVVTKALNDLAIRTADAERERMRQVFTIRNEGVLKYGIARTHTATKREPWTDVHIGTQRAGSRSAFGYLEKFEEGGRKGADASQPFGPPGDKDTTVAVPSHEVRRTRKGVVVKTNRIAALNLKRTDGQRVQGDRRTFLLKTKGKGNVAGLILQRVRSSKKRNMGPHQRGHDPNVKVLYVLKRSVPVRAVLRFYATGLEIARRETADIWAKAWDYAMRTAR